MPHSSRLAITMPDQIETDLLGIGPGSVSIDLQLWRFKGMKGTPDAHIAVEVGGFHVAECCRG